MKKPIQARIPKAVRRLPLLRDIRLVQYSEASDTARRSRIMQQIFPNLKIDDESIHYTESCVFTMSARVGSTALLRWLQSAGLSNGVIHEILNTRGAAQGFVDSLKTESLCQYLNAHATRCGNERLLFKTGWWDMAAFLALVDGAWQAWLPQAKWVHLERQDTVAQAYSLWKLARFKVNHRETDEPYTSPVTDVIPIDAIRERKQLIEMENDCWKRFFETMKIDPHCVYYEDFVENPLDTMTEVFSLCSSAAPDTEKGCPLTRTTDDTDLQNIDYLRSRLA